MSLIFNSILDKSSFFSHNFPLGLQLPNYKLKLDENSWNIFFEGGTAYFLIFSISKSSAAEFKQYLRPVGLGPSGKT
jgi:hypothetical protein